MHMCARAVEVVELLSRMFLYLGSWASNRDYRTVYHQLASFLVKILVDKPSYTIKYESGCLLNSFALINGPSGFGFSGRGVQLACVAALGLKDGSVGETKE